MYTTDTDAANEDIDRAIIQTVTTHNSGDGAAQDVVVSQVTDELGIETVLVDHRIGKLLQESRGIYNPLDDKLRPV